MKLLAYTGNDQIDETTGEESDGFEPVPDVTELLSQLLIERYWHRSTDFDVQIFDSDASDIAYLKAVATREAGAAYIVKVIEDNCYTILRWEGEENEV